MGGFYRRSARKMKRRFDPRQKPTERWHVLCAINTPGQLVRTVSPSTRHFNHHPINFITVYLAFQPSSHWLCHRLLGISTVIPINLVTVNADISAVNPLTSILQLVLIWLSPQLAPFSVNDGPKGVKGAIEEDKNEARQAWLDGPDGSISMG